MVISNEKGPSAQGGNLQTLRSMQYPGRVIIIGRTRRGQNVVAYVLTGRGSSSKARRLVRRGDGVVVEVSDEKALAEGNRGLLVYDAFVIDELGVFVSNGAQTRLIAERSKDQPWETPSGLLTFGMEDKFIQDEIDITSYEPDVHATSRISGCVRADNSALQIVARNPDATKRVLTSQLPLDPGWGWLVATYNGEDRDPLPAFIGGPRNVTLSPNDAPSIAHELRDDVPKAVFVSVAVVLTEPNMSMVDCYIINAT